MTQISIKNFKFAYDCDSKNIFENVSFCFDTNWKVGLIGINGRGKTSILKLMMGEKICYCGEIVKPQNLFFSYVCQD